MFFVFAKKESSILHKTTFSDSFLQMPHGLLPNTVLDHAYLLIFSKFANFENFGKYQ